MSTEIIVCVRCRPPETLADQPRAGLALFEEVQMVAFNAEPELIVRSVECMSACKRFCTVAFQSANKITYLFGDLSADPADAADILVCAKLYQASPDGFMSRDSRPKRLQEGILARIPVLSSNWGKA